MNSRGLVFSVAIICLAPLKLLGWGAGHDPLNELAAELLVGVVPPESTANIVKWSHTPDDFTPWAKLTHFEVSPVDLETLAAYQLTSPYSLHAPRGQAVTFILLVNAFRDGDAGRIAFWSACMLHVLADEAACNHDPLIHYATYGFQGGYRLKTGPGVGLDFAEVARGAEGRALVRRLAAEQPARSLPADPDEALLTIMLSGLESNAFMTRRGSTIAGSFAIDAKPERLTAARTALAELGVYGAVHGRDVIRAALAFAKAGKVPTLTPQLEAEYEKRKAAYAATRPLSDDSLYADLLPHQAADGQAAVGLLVEPSLTMNKARFSFGGKLITAAAARSLHLANVPFRLLDVRTPESGKALDHRTIPVLFVCAGPFQVEKAVRDALTAYAAAGGRFLWIGGEHGQMLGHLSKALVKAAPDDLPVSNRYGQDTPLAATVRFRFCGGLRDALGDRLYRFVHNPNTQAGWQTPRCGYVLAPTADIMVLAEMYPTAPEPSAAEPIEATQPGNVSATEPPRAASAIPLAGAWLGKDETAKAIFIPEYLVAPYLLSDEGTIPDLSRPTLDEVGTRVLSACLKLFPPTAGEVFQP